MFAGCFTPFAKILVAMRKRLVHINTVAGNDAGGENEKRKMNTHIIELNGEPVVSLSEDRGGKANVGCGPREKAIKYTAEEAAEVVEWIGIGAEAVAL